MDKKYTNDKSNNSGKQDNLFKRIFAIGALLLIVIALQFGISKFVGYKESSTELNFYEYRIATSEIVTSPQNYTGGEVTVEINTQKTGLSIQYQLGDEGEWIDYTGSFSVDENTKINTRLVSEADNFEGPVTSKDIKNIAVAKIGDEYYKTLAAAIEACPENAGDSQTKIEMLANTTESVVIPEGKNIVLDLCGATAAGTENAYATITVSGQFNLIDSAQNEDGTLQGNGKIESTTGVAIKVEQTGNFTLGTNESGTNVSVSIENPKISGGTYGVIVEEGGEFNFYDGEISGKTEAINGTVTDTPDGYDVITNQEGEYEVATLKGVHTVTFDKNADNATVEFETLVKYTGEEIASLPTAQREGYELKGWFTEKENGTQITLETVITQDVTYYAQWEANKYTIEYNSNGGTGTTENTEVTYDEEATISENTFTPPTGYTFKEWNTAADGTGTSYQVGDTVSNLTSQKDGTVTLYAIWEDTIAPTTTAPTGTGTTRTITVNCNQTDSGTGIDETAVEYAIFNKDTDGDGNPDAWSEWQTSNIFEGLEANTQYQVKTRVTDNSGNGPTESEVGTISTSTIENGTIVIHKDTVTGEIITPETSPENKDNQINNDIYLDITASTSGTTTVTVKTPLGETNTYVDDTTITTQTGVYEITIETTDGTNTVTDTYYVVVDRTEPTINPTSSKMTNSITVNANAEDEDSGVNEVTYTIKDGDTIIETNTTGEFTGLEDGKEFTVEITVTDKAGNTATATEVVSTEKLVAGSLTFTETTTSTQFTPKTTYSSNAEDKVWINENVYIELTKGNAGTTSYTIDTPHGIEAYVYTGNLNLSTDKGDYSIALETTDGTNTENIIYYFSVDKSNPTVTINPNTQEYTIAVGNNMATIGTTLTATDDESGISTTKYAWSSSRTEEPESWSDFTSGVEITTSVQGGIYYLWTNVIDKAGNRATSVKTSGEFNVGYAVEYDLNGGTGTIESQRKEHGIDLSLTKTIPTKEGYVFKGWATTADNTTPEYTITESSSTLYTTDASVKLYAVWGEVVASTTINGVTTNYESVQDAVDAAGASDATVTLLKETITESITIAAGQNIELDTNGKTLTSNEQTITNIGTLSIKGSGKIVSTENFAINNTSTETLIIDGVTIQSDASRGINNVSTGTINILGGTIKGQSFGIFDNVSGTINIQGGTVEAVNGTAIRSYGTNLDISGEDTLIKGNYGIYEYSTADINITGGKIQALSSHGIRFETGTLNISGENTEIEGVTRGITATTGNITITSGNIKATNGIGIRVQGGTLTLGVDEEIPSVTNTTPVIIGTESVVTVIDGTFNFYDGIIKVPTGNTTITSPTPNTPEGCRITNGTETIDSVVYETAYLNNAYHIIFDDNCENGSTQTLDITYNSKLGTLPTPIGTVQGYTFSGWFTDKTAGTQITAETLVTQDITYYAHWEPNTDTEYTVYHYRENANDTNYELVQTQYLQGTTDSTLTLADLTKAGENQLTNCAVVKTTLTENGTSELTTTIAPDGSTKIYIYYSRNTFTLEVTAGQNINTVTGSGAYKWGQTVEISAEVASVEGYTYDNFNWATTTENINIAEIVTDKTQTQTILTMPAQATQVTATSNRTAIIYNLTYDLDGGQLADGETNPSTYTVEDEITLKSPTKQGYTFVGWKLSTLNGEIVENSTVTNTIIVGSTGNREYTAVYSSSEVSYTVYHYLENANDTNYTLYNTEVREAKTNDVIALDSSVAIQVPNATYAKSTETEGGAQGTTITVAADSSSKIYVYYTRNTYELTLVAGDNIDIVEINNVAKTESTFKYGATINISATMANLNGYTYSNFRWETADNSILASTTANSTTVTMPTSNTTITAAADRKANEYTVSYELDGGIVEGTNPTTYTVESADITLINPTKTGYTFAGWTGTDLSTPTKDVTITTGSYGDREYTATWEINNYTVTYDYGTNGGALSTDSSVKTEDVQVDYNSAIDLSKIASKENYTFIGWNTDKDATTAIDTLTMGTENVTLYAIYSKEVTVTYNKNGGSTDITQTYTMYNTNTNLEITIPEPTTCAGWTFNGYGETNTSTSGDTQGTTKTITVAENVTEVTYYHTWKKTITFNANKPENAEASYDVEMAETTREIYYNNEFGTLPGNPTLAGWTFNGWYTTANAGTQITQETLAQNIPENIYAQWELSATMSVNPEEVTFDLSQNASQAITITGSNYGTASFETANNLVATVDETGIITAVSNGTTQITVTGSNGQITKTVEVTVITTPTSVEISQDSALIGIISNNTVALYTTINPETANSQNTVTWSSNNTSVATVDATTGVVTGLKEGTAIITATTENGCTDTSEITVDGTAPIVEVSIDNSEYAQNHTVTATITDNIVGLPASTEISYAWSTNKDEVPESWNTKTITVAEGAKTTSTTIQAPSGETGIYYLWIKSGVQDKFGNSTASTYINENVAAKLDNTAPVIELNGTSSQTKASVNSNITIPVKVVEAHSGMNTTGATADCLTQDDIVVKVNGTVVTPTTKELVYNSESNGVYNYTLNLSGVEGNGKLSIEIDSGKIVDKAGNINAQTTLNTGVTMEIICKIIFDENYSEGTTTVVNINYNQPIGSLPIPIRENYVFDGWYTDVAAGEKITEETIVTSDATYYAHWVIAVASTTIGNSVQYYNSVQDAIDAAGTNSGAIVTLLEETITESVTIAEGQDLILNLNGNTLTYTSAVTLTNNGTLTIEGDGALTGNGASGVYPITNKGTLIKNGSSTLASTTAASSSTIQYIINNTQTGTVVINEGTITSNDRGIYNAGGTNNASLTINGGTITTVDYAIYNLSQLSEENNPSVKISNAEITSSGGVAVFNDDLGNVEVENSTITASSYGIQSDNSGTITIKDSTITSTTSWGVCNSSNGTINVYNSNITGYIHGIGNTTAATGPINVYSGNITGETNDGIAVGKGTVTIGTDDGIISVTNPKIQGKRYGLNMNSTGGKVYFYDGIIKGSSGNSIYGSITEIPEGYEIQKTTANSIETSILVREVASTTIGENVTIYGTVQEAINAAGTNSGAIVTLLKSSIEESITVAEGQNIILNTNGNTLTSSSGYTLTNNGTLEINGSGNIIGTGYDTISNKRTLTVTESINVESNTSGSYYAIDNYGTVEMESGTITSTYRAIRNQSSATLSISGGEINADGAGIYNLSTSQSAITITNGTITSELQGIFNNAVGTISISGSTSITGTAGIFNSSTGTVNVSGTPTITGTSGAGLRIGTGTCTLTGGTITGSTYGIYVTTGTLTIGEQGGTPSTTVPSITGGESGLAVDNASATVSFYDGIIKGKSAIFGIIDNVEEGYGIFESTTDGIQTAILVIQNYVEYNGDVVVNSYETLAIATENAISGNTIKVVNSITESTAATVASDKTLTLDLNGQTLTISSVKLTNNGTLTITDSSSGTTGELVEVGTAGNPTTAPISNYGKIIFEVAKITSNTAVVYNQSTGRIVIDGANIEGAFIPIYNVGTSTDMEDPSVKMISGALTTTGNAPAIMTSTTGAVYITGGTINANSLCVNGGDIKITNGTFNGTSSNTPTIATGNTIEISGGTFNATYMAVSLTSNCVGTITGGTFNCTSTGYGAIVVNSTATLTLGTNDGTTSTTVPSITGAKYGVDNNSGGTFNFYDGIIKGPSGASINGTVAAVPTGYRVVKGSETINGTTYETSYLDNTYYVTYNDNCDNGGTTVAAVTYNNQIGTLPQPTIEPASTEVGYVFDGWYTAAEGGTKITTSTVVTSDVTYYAQWRNYYLSEVGAIGEYVNYSASNNGTYSYSTNSSLTGSTTSSTFSSSDSLTWKILNINEQEGTVELMSANPTESTVSFMGTAGYINAVDVLDTIAGVYAHGLGAMSGRSLAWEDIEGYSSYNLSDYVNSNGYYIGDTENYTSGTFVNKDGSLVQASERNVITVEQTAYTYKDARNYIDEDPYVLFFRNSNNNSDKAYWLANTSEFLDPSRVSYEIRRINAGGLSHREVYASDLTETEQTQQVVPVIKLYATVTVTGKDSNGAWNITFDSAKEAEYNVNNISIIDEDLTLESNGSLNNSIQTNNSILTNTGTSINSGTSANVGTSTETGTSTDSEETGNNVEIEKNVQIGESYYATLAEAINAAVDGDTIKILNDISLEETITISKNITIDLNSKTISSTSVNTITNNGTLTITGTGILRNDIENGSVIYNKGTLNIENGIITTSANGGKGIHNDSGVVNMNSGKIVTEGIGAYAIYNVNGGKVVVEDGIVETRGTSSKAIYNDAELQINGGEIIVSADDSIGIYNLNNATKCVIKNVEILVEADVIENYDEIKNTDEFKAELEQMKSSYGIYNNSSINVEIQTATITVERLKGVGILNNSDGTITLGTQDSQYNSATPIIYAISDNTTAIINNENGEINFFDGRLITLDSIKEVITNILDNYEIIEEVGNSVINTMLQLIEVIEVVEETEVVEENEVTEETEVIEETEVTEENEASEESETTNTVEQTQDAESTETTQE